jgi:hypothetical protein
MKVYFIAVILRNISIGINIARWLITLSQSQVAKMSQTKFKKNPSINDESEKHEKNKSKKILISLCVYIAIELIICLYMLIDFSNAKKLFSES